jgi:hypothetical protein
VDRDREQLLVCDLNGSHDGDFYGFTLPRTELMTLLRRLTADLDHRFG